MTAARWILRAVLLALFWACVAIWFCVSSGCTHHPDCLCSKCEARYDAQWWADHQAKGEERR